jgi:hypothetical protein
LVWITCHFMAISVRYFRKLKNQNPQLTTGI